MHPVERRLPIERRLRQADDELQRVVEELRAAHPDLLISAGMSWCIR